MWKKLIISVVSVCVGTLLALFGKPYIEQKIQERKVPILLKKIYRTDITGLSEELQRKITVLPVKYTLEHKVGGSAKNLTIYMRSETSISPSELSFGEKFEDYITKQVDKNSIKIDIPTVRPGGIITFELLTGINNKIQFQELVEVGKIHSEESYKVQDKQFEYLIIVGIVLFVIIWGSVIIIIIYGVLKVRVYWRNMELSPDRTSGNIRGPLITLMIIIILYNLIQNSLGAVSGFLPLPYISFGSLFYAFSLYLLITRYKLIEDVLKKIVGKDTHEDKSLDEHINQ